MTPSSIRYDASAVSSANRAAGLSPSSNPAIASSTQPRPRPGSSPSQAATRSRTRARTSAGNTPRPAASITAAQRAKAPATVGEAAAQARSAGSSAAGSSFRDAPAGFCRRAAREKYQPARRLRVPFNQSRLDGRGVSLKNTSTMRLM